MDNAFANEPMLDIYIYESTQNIEQLEDLMLTAEKVHELNPSAINEIFRIMHTIKGSSAMMMYNEISSLAHAMEDLFFYIREDKPETVDFDRLSDLIFEGVDFIKIELDKLRSAKAPDGKPDALIEAIRDYLSEIKGEQKQPQPQKKKAKANAAMRPFTKKEKDLKFLKGEKSYEAIIYFDKDCGMEHIRAFSIVHHLKELASSFYYFPEDITDGASAQVIQEQGFHIVLQSDRSPKELNDFFANTAFVRHVDFSEWQEEEGKQREQASSSNASADTQEIKPSSAHQSIISVDVDKLDRLMDLMGEMVIAEAMVVHNPEIQDLKLESFSKSMRHLQKITDEMQDMVMSIRMVPLLNTFNKMHRVVRDMSKKLGKEVQLKLIGAETEVDKNIIEKISDPLMHLVRNSVDHGIELPEEREAKNKPRVGVVVLEAQNAGSNVVITIRDDGKGLNKEKILKRAKEQGILTKPADQMTDREIYNLIFMPGFTTNNEVTEYSGRGVGMDVVVKNLEAIGGVVTVDSAEDIGTLTTLKIPLTLAIVDGMNIRVGEAKYTIPTISIRETFKAKHKDIVVDPDGHEMIMVRGECYLIIRLHELFGVETTVHDFEEGIMLMVEQDGKCRCLFADELLGQYQVVVKALPAYIKRVDKLAGCTLLGDGSISLILNIGTLVSM